MKVKSLSRSLPLAVLQLPDLNEQSLGQSGGEVREVVGAVAAERRNVYSQERTR